MQTNKVLVGVFYQSDSIDIAGVEDSIITLFDDDKSAVEFMFSKLVQSGYVKEDDGCYTVDDVPAEDGAAHAIELVQDGFERFDYFHAYQIDDRRTSHSFTDDQLAAIFDEWHRQQVANHDEFDQEEESAAMNYGSRCAELFLEIAAQLQRDTVPAPAPKA